MNYAIREVTVPAAAAAKAGKKLLGLNIGDPNKWDFETPEYFKATLRAAVDETDNGYGDSQGNLDLREAIVQREYEKHGAVITPQDVYVTAGVSEYQGPDTPPTPSTSTSTRAGRSPTGRSRRRTGGSTPT